MELKRIAIAIVGSALLWFPVGHAAALDLGEWVPGLKVSPFLGERVEYETNVLQVHSHSQSDVVFKTIPGFVADYTFGPHSASAGYRAEILRYVDLTNQDTVHHIAAAQLNLDFPRTRLNFRDDFVRTSDPPNTELTGRILSNTNTLKPSAEYRLTPRFSTGLAYSWIYQRFDDKSIGDLIDRDEHLVLASIFWKFIPRADVGLNYGIGRTTFVTADRDYTRQQVTISLRGDITPKLTSTFRVGWELRDPDNSNQESGSGFYMGGEWAYKPTERTIIRLVTERSIQESTFGTTTFYTTTAAQLLAQHQLLPKLSIGARLGGGRNDYSTKDTFNGKTDFRQDWFFVAGANVEYNIQRWLRVGLEYLRTSRTSNFDPFSFVDERVSGKVTLQF
jgi:Putative beta-barrel porin 2